MSSRGPVIAAGMPKPCLKQAAPGQNAQKHAHFPPPSEEARRYSGIEYDRTPIAIATNELALPARGCPGRTFDDLDAHQYRHHLKKLRCLKQQFARSLDSSIYSETPKFGRLTLPADSALPSLVHADTSESEEDEVGRISDSEGLRHYPVPQLTENGASTTQPKRLRKVHRPRGNPTTAAGWSGHRVNLSTCETTSTSIFASCPGSNSCLGGF